MRALVGILVRQRTGERGDVPCTLWPLHALARRRSSPALLEGRLDRRRAHGREDGHWREVRVGVGPVERVLLGAHVLVVVVTHLDRAPLVAGRRAARRVVHQALKRAAGLRRPWPRCRRGFGLGAVL